MGIREREGRQEGECLAAAVANTAADLDPVVVCVVRLLSTAPVADDRSAITNRAQPREELGPVRFEVVLLTGT